MIVSYTYSHLSTHLYFPQGVFFFFFSGICKSKECNNVSKVKVLPRQSKILGIYIYIYIYMFGIDSIS